MCHLFFPGYSNTLKKNNAYAGDIRIPLIQPDQRACYGFPRHNVIDRRLVFGYDGTAKKYRIASRIEEKLANLSGILDIYWTMDVIKI